MNVVKIRNAGNTRREKVAVMYLHGITHTPLCERKSSPTRYFFKNALTDSGSKTFARTRSQSLKKSQQPRMRRNRYK